MSKATIVSKAKQFSERVSKTVVELAHDLAMETWNTFGDDITNEVAADMAKEIDSVPARVSEWKAFFMAVPLGLPEAIKEYPKHGTMTRIKMFALARACLKRADYSQFKLAVKDVESSASKKSKGAGRKATIGMGLGIIKNAETRKRNEIAFRKELAALCKKHGISY